HVRILACRRPGWQHSSRRAAACSPIENTGRLRFRAALSYFQNYRGASMQDLNDLYYFVQTVDHRGFAPAGRALGMPKSTLSRRIAVLEERLGGRLIQRSTRHFSVTDIGQTYYEHCKAMLVGAEAAQEAIDAAQVEPRGVVRLSCPVALL